MRADRVDLTEGAVPFGYWMAQEKPVEMNAAMDRSLAMKLPEVWPAAAAT